MRYVLADLSAEDLVTIGEALDMLPMGRVRALHARLQQQIFDQEQAHKAAQEASSRDNSSEEKAA